MLKKITKNLSESVILNANFLAGFGFGIFSLSDIWSFMVGLLLMIIGGYVIWENHSDDSSGS